MGRDLECCRKKVVGKPYEGEPHVRIEVAGDGNQDRDGLLRHSQRKRGATDRPGLRPRRHSLTLPTTGHAPLRHPAIRGTGTAEALCAALCVTTGGPYGISHED